MAMATRIKRGTSSGSASKVRVKSRSEFKKGRRKVIKSPLQDKGHKNEMKAFIAAGPPPVYLTLGSPGNLDPRRTAEADAAAPERERWRWLGTLFG